MPGSRTPRPKESQRLPINTIAYRHRRQPYHFFSITVEEVS